MMDELKPPAIPLVDDIWLGPKHRVVGPLANPIPTPMGLLPHATWTSTAALTTSVGPERLGDGNHRVAAIKAFRKRGLS